MGARPIGPAMKPDVAVRSLAESIDAKSVAKGVIWCPATFQIAFRRRVTLETARKPAPRRFTLIH